MAKFIKPDEKSIIYQDKHLYVCLAKYAVTEGHIVVVWKKDVADLKLLSDRDYDYLMDTVFATRNALLKTMSLKKVYLVYMDESNHVHWHLIPRYKEQGFEVFQKKPKTLEDFSLAQKIKGNLIFE